MKLLDGVEKNYDETLKRLADSEEFNLLNKLVKNVKHHWRNLLVHLSLASITYIISKS